MYGQCRCVLKTIQWFFIIFKINSGILALPACSTGPLLAQYRSLVLELLQFVVDQSWISVWVVFNVNGGASSRVGGGSFRLRPCREVTPPEWFSYRLIDAPSGRSHRKKAKVYKKNWKWRKTAACASRVRSSYSLITSRRGIMIRWVRILPKKSDLASNLCFPFNQSYFEFDMCFVTYLYQNYNKNNKVKK